MVRKALNRIPFWLKIVFLWVGMSMFIGYVLWQYLGINKLSFDMFMPIALSVSMVMGVSLWLLYKEAFYYLRGLEKTLDNAVRKRNFNLQFHVLNTRDIFMAINKASSQLTQLFRSFDQMKSARVSLEVASMKQVMNVVTEGVVLLNKDKVITHMNHAAEVLFGVLPGDTIGDLISRHISHDDILKGLTESLQEGHRVVIESCEIKGKIYSEVSFLPIKDKKHLMERIIIVLKQ